jgi:hypothetical protein
MWCHAWSYRSDDLYPSRYRQSACMRMNAYLDGMYVCMHACMYACMCNSCRSMARELMHGHACMYAMRMYNSCPSSDGMWCCAWWYRSDDLYPNTNNLHVCEWMHINMLCMHACMCVCMYACAIHVDRWHVSSCMVMHVLAGTMASCYCYRWYACMHAKMNAHVHGQIQFWTTPTSESDALYRKRESVRTIARCCLTWCLWWCS